MVKVRVFNSDGIFRGGLFDTECSAAYRSWPGKPNSGFIEILYYLGYGCWIKYQESRNPDYEYDDEGVPVFDKESQAYKITSSEAAKWFDREGLEMPQDLLHLLDTPKSRITQGRNHDTRSDSDDEYAPAPYQGDLKKLHASLRPIGFEGEQQHIETRKLDVVVWNNKWIEVRQNNKRICKLQESDFQSALWFRLCELAHSEGRLPSPDPNRKIKELKRKLSNKNSSLKQSEIEQKILEIKKEYKSWCKKSTRLAERLEKLLNLIEKPICKEENGPYISLFKSLTAKNSDQK